MQSVHGATTSQIETHMKIGSFTATTGPLYEKGLRAFPDATMSLPRTIREKRTIILLRTQDRKSLVINS
jgi:hypothetical protein